MDGEIKGGGEFFFLSFLYFVIFILTHTHIYIYILKPNGALHYLPLKRTFVLESLQLVY